MQPDYIPKVKYTDKTANGLTRCVIDWITLNGGQAERINTTGRLIKAKTYKDVMGITKTIGQDKWIKGTGTLGSADISATIPVFISGKKIGLSVKIEVKIGKDYQKSEQIKYEEDVKKAGGYYYIVKNFDDFYKKYFDLINSFN